MAAKSAALALGLTCLTGPAPAHADSTSGNYSSECSSDYYCVWMGRNDTGSKASFQYTNYAWNDTTYAAWENQDSSSYNKGSSGSGVYLIADLGSSFGYYCARQYAYWRVHNPEDRGVGNEWTSDC
jgi:hypothetical protein